MPSLDEFPGVCCIHPLSVDDINYLTWSPLLQIRTELKNTFASGRTKSVIWRQQQLLQLARLVQDNADTVAEAISKDLGKPRFEVFLSEINLMTQRSIEYAKEIGEWTKDEDMSQFNEDWQGGWIQKARKEPKGVVLIIAYALLLPITDFLLTSTIHLRPWNFPLVLSLQPLYGAIAAGCCAVVKTSEIVPSFSRVFAELLPKYLDNDAFKVIQGSVPEITRLLELQCASWFYYSMPSYLFFPSIQCLWF